VINKFPNGTPKRRPNRNDLLAALAALQLVSTGAAAAEKKPMPPSAGWAGKVRPELPKANKKTEGKQRMPVDRSKTSVMKERVTEEQYAALLSRLQGTNLKYGGEIQRLPQYDEFCNELSIFCQNFANHDNNQYYEADLTYELFTDITGINLRVNKGIKEKEDLLLYETIEKWTVPFDAGDCEDFVLLKMVRLISAGFSPATLHILVVHDEKGDGHAILGVDTFYNGSWNTLVLDNKTNDIITLDEMEKKYTGSLMSYVVRFNSGEQSVQFFHYNSNRKGK
jgi:predicted transglutaminase-like cysteine proteinase